MPRSISPAVPALLALFCGCGLLPSSGGGKAWFRAPRVFAASDIRVEAGYRIELVAADLTFPTGAAFDDEGALHVVEAGYSRGEAWAEPRLLRLEGGRWTVVANGSRNGPWNGVAFHRGAFFVAEGGALEGGRLLRISRDGKVERLVEGLPSLGDYHTTGPAVGPDGLVYFGQGTATNSGVVGEDNLRAGWLGRFPLFHDVPCEDVVLAGANFTSSPSTVTGAFQPFGSPNAPGKAAYASLRCGGSVLRVGPSGGTTELVAWGLRNPFGLAFSPAGALFAVDQGCEERGSRPVRGAPDAVWRVEPGRWHGWPDYAAGRPLSGSAFRTRRGPRLTPLFSSPPGRVPEPLALLPSGGGASGLDFSRSDAFGHKGQAFVALFGDLAPVTGKVPRPVGFKIVHVDPATGSAADFAVNRGRRRGPASRLMSGGLERPVAVRFDRAGEALYVVDYGVVTTNGDGLTPYKGTGAVWRITREPRTVGPALR